MAFIFQNFTYSGDAHLVNDDKPGVRLDDFNPSQVSASGTMVYGIFNLAGEFIQYDMAFDFRVQNTFNPTFGRIKFYHNDVLKGDISFVLPRPNTGNSGTHFDEIQFITGPGANYLKFEYLLEHGNSSVSGNLFLLGYSSDSRFVPEPTEVACDCCCCAEEGDLTTPL